MVINRDASNEEPHVRFVSYTGKYPHLCSGMLTLEVDGRTYCFGNVYNNKEYLEHMSADTQQSVQSFYFPFWLPGGHGWGPHTTGEWMIDYGKLPAAIRQYADEIDKVFNENVEWGCCGGCS